MRQTVAVLLVLLGVIGLSASASAVGTASSGVMNAFVSSMTGVLAVSTLEVPPEKPEGDEQPGGENPPAKPGEGDDTGGGTGGGTGVGSDDSVVLTGAYQYTSETNTLSGATLESETSDQNVILAMTNAYVTVSNCVLKKTGDMSDEDNSNFYAVNAVVAAKTASMICIADSTLTSDANGANCLFASGEGSTIYAYHCTLTSAKSSSRGLDATYEGTVIAAKMSISTTNDHCAALATDRGNGSISVTGAELKTAGQGSPLIYSTGAIEVNAVTGTASGAQIAGIEGLSEIRIKNSNLTGSGKQASEPVANGVIIYQSNSGDYTTGTATFEVSDSSLTSGITTNGALFYITHSEAVITVKNTILDFDSSNNYLIKAAGNNGENNWGTEGSNGAGVIFTAINQTLKGNISVDGISSNDLYLVNSTYTGTFIKDDTYKGNGGANVFVDADSTWSVTSNCTLKCLTAATGAKIVDGSGNVVSIVGTDGTEYVSGTSNPKITVSSYTESDFVATNITKFTISRTAFDAMFGTSESEEGGTEAVTPGVASAAYSDAQAATNAAVAINADKTGRIAVPEGVGESYVADYLSKVEATVTGDNCVVVDLTSEAQSNEQVVVDAAVTSEFAVVALTSTNLSAKATIAPTTPGLYYWIVGGTDVDSVTNAGTGVLSTNGGSVELTKPTLDATPGRAFFKISAGVAAPAGSNGD